MEQTGLVGFFSILSRPSQLLTFSPSLDEGFIKNYNRNRKNPCGKLVFVDFRTRSVFAVGEALMPPAYTLRFRLTVR